MMISKFKLAIIVSAAGAMALIDRGNYFNVQDVQPERGVRVASLCPDYESVPHSPECLKFLGTSDVLAVRANAAQNTPPLSPDLPGQLHRPVCPPNNENVPYSAKCLRFLSGWFWHPPSDETR
ncbi:MAG TPA: hypothetical protein VH684_24235 [Xanthobacteraceae bacterium]|jgi:hypothetical protein